MALKAVRLDFARRGNSPLETEGDVVYIQADAYKYVYEECYVEVDARYHIHCRT